MKISDEKLSEYIGLERELVHLDARSNLGEAIGDEVAADMLSALEELQQRRGDARWMEIVKEKPERKEGNTIIAIFKGDGFRIPASLFFRGETWWNGDDGYYVDEDTITYWRPLPMDLPEEE